MGLSERDVDVLMTIDADIEVGFDGKSRQGAVAFFDEVSQGRSPKLIVNWCVARRPLESSANNACNFRLTNELLGQLTLRQSAHPFQANPVSVAQFGELIDLVASKKITGVASPNLC